MRLKSVLIFVLSVLLPPVATVAATAYAYQTGSPPFQPDWPVYGVVAGMVLGVSGIALLPFRGAVKRLLLLVVYVPVMSVFLWAIVYIIGCFNGNCQNV